MVYLPPLFTETREDVLIAHIERHDFGLLVTDGADALVASQIPFLVERRGDGLFLLGHLARANPQVADLSADRDALAVFTGPHAYISPGWYAAGPAVPTWNYASVHAYGPARAIDDPEWLRGLVARLSERHEAREAASPWRMQELPERYLASMLAGIVGIEIAIGRLEGKFKLSQNRSAADRAGVLREFAKSRDSGIQEMLELMRGLYREDGSVR